LKKSLYLCANIGVSLHLPKFLMARRATTFGIVD